MRFGPVGKVLLHRDADIKLQMSRLNSTTKPPRTVSRQVSIGDPLLIIFSGCRAQSAPDWSQEHRRERRVADQCSGTVAAHEQIGIPNVRFDNNNCSWVESTHVDVVRGSQSKPTFQKGFSNRHIHKPSATSRISIPGATRFSSGIPFT